MKELALTIAAIASWLSVPVWIVYGLKVLFSNSAGLGFLMIFIVAPVALAHGVVFDYVREVLRSKDSDVEGDEPTNPAGVSNDLRGTPWERDSGHTLK